MENLVIPERNLSCEEHAYRGVHVLSREPLVVYIEGFVGDGEADDVVKVRYVKFVMFWETRDVLQDETRPGKTRLTFVSCLSWVGPFLPFVEMHLHRTNPRLT